MDVERMKEDCSSESEWMCRPGSSHRLATWIRLDEHSRTRSEGGVDDFLNGNIRTLFLYSLVCLFDITDSGRILGLVEAISCMAPDPFNHFVFLIFICSAVNQWRMILGTGYSVSEIITSSHIDNRWLIHSES